MLLLSVVGSWAEEPECCLCKVITKQIDQSLEEIDLDQANVEFFTRYTCYLLRTNTEECNKMIQGFQVLTKKILIESPPRTWCENMGICEDKTEFMHSNMF